jgi:hypothetical protein
MTRAAQRFPLAGLIWLALCCAAHASQVTPTGGQQVTLGWNASADPTVVGYYFYYGTTSGVYTNKIDVGTNTSYAAAGLVAGSTYYFSSTSYNAARIESAHTAEVTYVVPGVLALSHDAAGATTRIQFPVAPTHSYQLQCSTDLVTWTNLWQTPTQMTNGWIEYDEPLSHQTPSRFYRLVLN